MIIQNKCPGFSVIGTAEDGKSALEQLEYLCPDVLITDVRMPVMDGIYFDQKSEREVSGNSFGDRQWLSGI